MAEKEYIERKKLLDTLNEEKIPYNSDINYIITTIPAADVRENVKGEWITEYEPNGKPYCFHCSACDDDFHFLGITSAYKFCPNCGAEMGSVLTRNARIVI